MATMTSQDRKAAKAAKLAEEIILLCRMEDVSLSKSTLRIKLGSILGHELSHRNLDTLTARLADTRQYVEAGR